MEEIRRTVGKPVVQLIDGYGRAQFTVGGSTAGLVVLRALRKQAEQAIGIKPISSTPLWPLLQFLPPGPALASLSDGV